MLKRPFFALLGLGAGLTLGAWSVRAVEQARRRLAPEQLAAGAGARAGSLRDRLALAVGEGRAAAAAKEAQLRADFRVREVPEPVLPARDRPPPAAGGAVPPPPLGDR